MYKVDFLVEKDHEFSIDINVCDLNNNKVDFFQNLIEFSL